VANWSAGCLHKLIKRVPLVTVRRGTSYGISQIPAVLACAAGSDLMLVSGGRLFLAHAQGDLGDRAAAAMQGVLYL
jgi:hypothetical protein